MRATFRGRSVAPQRRSNGRTDKVTVAPMGRSNSAYETLRRLRANLRCATGTDDANKSDLHCGVVDRRLRS